MPDIFPAPDQDDNALDALFATPQIRTDEDGRHFDAEGREYRIATVGIDGELTFEPLEPEPSRGAPSFEQVTALVASWSAPSWASRSRVDDSGITHSFEPSTVCTALGDHDEEVVVTPSLVALDDIDVDRDGRITVTRSHAPVIAFDTLRLTIAQAEHLGAVLQGLARRAARS
ncbi:MAG: hypothetical protein U0Q19_17060 [Kineosporiaceae bacterium]